MFFVASFASASNGVTYSREDSLMLVRLLSEGKLRPKGTNLVLFFARKFMGRPYVAHTLEVNKKERLVVNLRELDCTTYIETVLALTMTVDKGGVTFKDYCNNLTMLRYKNGMLNDYSSRLHYFTEWINDNVKKGIVKEVMGSKELFCGVQTVDATYMTSHSDSYKMLAGDTAMIRKIGIMEKEISGQRHRYIPNVKIDDTCELRKTIHDGDVIAIVTNKKGLEISHLGFAVWRRDGLHLLNASSVRRRVVEENATLSKYLVRRKTALGIRVLRLR
ncbi:DUF1460 domain-containing protein [Prevotella sp. OH937_COT-195]|nr:DUF1460 domain-containing protein [Prevotella sp. OH937_COT-195]